MSLVKEDTLSCFVCFAGVWFSVINCHANRRNDSIPGQIYTKVTGVLGLLSANKKKCAHLELGMTSRFPTYIPQE